MTNEENERMMYEWMERMEKQMETLIVVLQELRERQNRVEGGSRVENPGSVGLDNGAAQAERNRGEGIQYCIDKNVRVEGQPGAN